MKTQGHISTFYSMCTDISFKTFKGIIFYSSVLLLNSCVIDSALEKSRSLWTQTCYSGLEEDVIFLSGEDAADCGILSAPGWPVDDRSLLSVESCAKRAVRSGRAFRFGYESYGDDSLYCKIAIQTTEGRLISFYFDSDVTGQFGMHEDSRSALWISTCKAIKFEAGTIGLNSFFSLEECTQSPEIAQSLFDAEHNND